MNRWEIEMNHRNEIEMKKKWNRNRNEIEMKKKWNRNEVEMK